MSWVAAGVSIGSAILGHKGKKDADKQASGDRARELTIQEGQLDIARRQDERASELFSHYRDTYLPRERELVREAFEGISPARAEARATTDVRSSLETARQMNERGIRRLGVNPSSGVAMSLDRTSSLEGARIEAGARTHAREGVRDQNFSRQAAVLGYAQPMAAGSYASSAAAGVADAGSLAGMRSRNSASYAHEAAVNSGALLSDAIDTGLGAWRNRRRRGEEAGGPFDERYGGYV